MYELLSMAFNKIKWLIPHKHIINCTLFPVINVCLLNIIILIIFHFRGKSQGPKLYSEKDLQSREYWLASDHHQINRNQRTSLQRIWIQSCQLWRIFTEAKLIKRSHHTVSLFLSKSMCVMQLFWRECANWGKLLYFLSAQRSINMCLHPLLTSKPSVRGWLGSLCLFSVPSSLFSFTLKFKSVCKLHITHSIQKDFQQSHFNQIWDHYQMICSILLCA